MKAIVVAFAVTTLVLYASVLQAGVVIEEQEVLSLGSGHSRTLNQTIMIEGNKRKLVTRASVAVTDLDARTVTVIFPERRSYLKLPFPKEGPLALGGAEPMAVDFEKTGEKRTIIGYTCDVYRGLTQIMGRQYSLTECFSSNAPGATDFTAFDRAMAGKLKGKSKGKVPEGVPLSMDWTFEAAKSEVATMPPNLPGAQSHWESTVIKTIVTKVKAEKLSPGIFEVPGGYRPEMGRGGR